MCPFTLLATFEIVEQRRETDERYGLMTVYAELPFVELDWYCEEANCEVVLGVARASKTFYCSQAKGVEVVAVDLSYPSS